MLTKTISKISVVFLGLAFFLFVGVTRVSAASFWLNPSSGTFAQGQSVSISVGVDTGGESVNAVQANLTYAADKFDFVSVSTGGSALTIVAEKSGGGGQIRIGGGALPPGFSGSKLIGTITLKAKASSGSTQISFNGDSSILRNSDSQNIKGGSPIATYNFGQAQASTSTTTPPPVVATAAPIAPTPFIVPTIKPVAVIPTAVVPTAAPTQHFYDNISPMVLYVVVAVSVLGVIACILYLIFSRNKS